MPLSAAPGKLAPQVLRMVALVVSLLAFQIPAHAAAAGDIIGQAIKGFVRPAYGAFHAATAKLDGEVRALCADPSQFHLSAARSAFVATVAAWGQVEPFRFGPITEENRLERILYWPDRKGIGLKQVQAALAEADGTVTDPAKLSEKSVAMQGLGALEFILFGTGSDALAAKGAPHRCAYAQAAARNIEQMANAVMVAWDAPDGISQQWAAPGPGNPLYRSKDEAMTELFNVFVHGLEMVRDVRLNGFLGETPKDDRPKQAIFWRSQATDVSLGANMEGLQKLFDASGIGALLAPDSAWIAQSINFEFNTAGRMLTGASGPIDTVLAGQQRNGLQAFRLISSHLSELFGVNLAGALGLTAGFSSLDGD